MESEGRQGKALKGKEKKSFLQGTELDEAGIGGHSKRGDGSTGGDSGGSSQPCGALVLGREESIDGLGDERLGSPLDHHHRETDVRPSQTYQRKRFCLERKSIIYLCTFKHQGRISR